MDLSQRHSEDLLNELRYFTGHSVHTFGDEWTIWKSKELGEAIPQIAWELIQRGELKKVTVLIDQSVERSHKWVCNELGFDFCL